MSPAPLPPRSSWAPDSTVRLGAGVALLSFCIVAMEVSLTRLFGWLLRYHFAFFAVSLSLCGLGLGGYAAHLLLRGGRVSERRLVLVAGYGVGGSTLAALTVILRFVIPRWPTAYALVGGLLMFPFFFAGLLLAIVFRRHASAINTLYAADLLGAALAAPGALLLLNLMGPVDSMLLMAALSAGVPLILIGTRRGIALPAAGLVAACACLSVASHRGDFLDLPLRESSLARVSEQLADAKNHGAAGPAAGEILKRLIVHLADSGGRSRIVHTEWNAFGRTDVEQVDAEPYWLRLWLDGDVPTPIMRFDGDYGKLTYLRRHPSTLPYRIRPLTLVLSLGSGGGLDVLAAKMHDAVLVDAVEINPAVARIMALPRYREFHGGVYDLPGVHLHLTEGRSFVKRSASRYDLIALSLTQAFTTGQVGVALMESYIHTLEACRDYFRHLGDGGMVMMLSGDRSGILPLRWFLTCLESVQLETGESTDAAASHLMLLESPPGWSPYDSVVLMSRRPFSSEEVERVLSLGPEMGEYKATFLPGQDSSLARAIHELGGRGVAERTRIELPRAVPGLAPPNVSPATDESPFFFDVGFGPPTALRHLLYLALGLSVIVLASAGLVTRGSPDHAAGSADIGSTIAAAGARGLLAFGAYFSFLGAGFMLIEVGLIQRLLILLGSPTHTVALILFAMLLGGACGARLGQRGRGDDPADRRAFSCAVVGCAAVLAGFVLPFVAETLLSAPYVIRLASGFVLCAGLGAVMGVPFPAGVRAATHWWPDSVPFLWAVNGVTSVVGSVLAAILGKTIGSSRVVLVGGVVYLVAAVWVAFSNPRTEAGGVRAMRTP
jgi:hypothetical protein